MTILNGLQLIFMHLFRHQTDDIVQQKVAIPLTAIP
ncbi:Uncharacterised protein [Legionella steigerwaltii]|uniref:Uncharacterized protein n=1 Tax=Legionella steigerwaltii TaxID=460 RepID=A0A378LAJ6_9GAMM|nr:Uncharacterised protein [Legionella steigerwaltii]